MLWGKLAPFFQEPSFRVINKIKPIGVRYPETRITADDDLILALFLAKNGYYNGSVDTVMNSRVDYVIQSFNYENFMKDYETTVTEMNKKERKWVVD